MNHVRGSTSTGKTGRRVKLAALLGLGLVGAVVWGPMIVPSGPRRAAGQSAQSSRSASAAGQGHSTPSAKGQAAIDVVWPAPLGRDPFAFDAAPYKRKPTKQPAVTVDETPEPEPEPTIDSQDVRDTLALEGTILGVHPRALINGKLYKLGQIVEGFEIKGIGDRRVTVHKNGVDVKLGM